MFFLLFSHHLPFQLAQFYSYFGVSLNYFLRGPSLTAEANCLIVFPVVVYYGTLCFSYFSQIMLMHTCILCADIYTHTHAV